MKILLLCPHFTPDLHAATGEVASQLVDALAERGHEVTVVTSLPWYKHHTVEKQWRGRPWRTEKTSWGQIVRVWPFPTNKANIPARAVGFGGFTALAATAALRSGRADVVMGMSPPIFLGDAGWLVSRRWRVPFVFNTQDIFPDVAVDLGALTNERVIKLAQRYERSIYRRSDAVTVLSTDQAENVSAKLEIAQPEPKVDVVRVDAGKPAPADATRELGVHAKVHVIHNFADLERVRVVERENEYRKEHGLEGKLVVMYSGNVGLSQSFDLVKVAAERWGDSNSEYFDNNVHFVINGEGAARPEIDAWSATLDNVTVADFASRSKVSEVLGAADLHLILLKPGLAKSSTPSKLYGILSAARPVLASIDVGSEVPTVVERAGCGKAVPPGNPDAFCSALAQMLAKPEELVEMGASGRDFVETWLTPAVQAQKYEELFASLVDKSPT